MTYYLTFEVHQHGRKRNMACFATVQKLDKFTVRNIIKEAGKTLEADVILLNAIKLDENNDTQEDLSELEDVL